MRRLLKSLPEIYANRALKRFTALGRQKYFMDDVELDDNFLRSNKRQIEIDEKLRILMRRGADVYTKNCMFGDEDIMNKKANYQTTAIAKTHCWILKIRQSTFKTEMKETARKIKEAKAVFIFYSLPNKNKAFGYMRFKDFFMRHFVQEKVKLHDKIIKQGKEADKIIVIKQGTFALTKKVYYNVGYYEQQRLKESEICLILTPGSIVGEDGFLYDQPNSYSVKSLWENGVIYSVDASKFSKKMEPFKKDFVSLLKKRHDLVQEKIDKLLDHKALKQSIAGPLPDKGAEKSKENFEIFKHFSHASKFPKQKFHLQIKKRNLEVRVTPEPVAIKPKTQFADFRLSK